MKASKIISIIIAIAIGLIIAVALKPDADKPLQKVNDSASQTAKKESLKTTEEATANIKTAETNLSNGLEDNDKKHVESNHTISRTDNIDVKSVQTTTIEKLIYMITLKTNMGDIEIALNAEKAPNTVENFINYAKSGQYNGTIFHRVIKGFMIQGGGFEVGMKKKEVGAPILNEANNGLSNNKYTIAMARTSDPHSATAQFFINATDNDFLNFTSESGSGWGYAVFGEVTKGQEIVDTIEAVRTGNSGGLGDVPHEDIIIESVVVAD